MAIRGDILKTELLGVTEFQTDEELEDEVKLIVTPRKGPTLNEQALEAVGVR
jgi:hypothetical protein